jgi:hypothetical protein
MRIPSIFAFCVSAFLVTEASAQVSFKKDIAPVLINNCLACHGPKKAEGSYRIDTYERAIAPGESATAAFTAKMLDKSVGASTLRLGFIADLSAQPGCGLLDFTLSPKPRAPRVSAKGNGRKKWFLFLTSRACQTASLTFLQRYVSSTITPFFSINCSLYSGTDSRRIELIP